MQITVQLADYFEVVRADDIRLKQTRIGIETILFEYLFRERSPQEIVQAYPSLSMEQVYATLLLYWHDRASVESYLQDWLEWGEEMRQLQSGQFQAVADRVQALKARRLEQE